MATAIELEAEAVRESGTSADEYMAASRAAFEAAAGDAMPNLTALADTDFDLDLDWLFDFGLNRLLDGLDVFISSRVKEGTA